MLKLRAVQWNAWLTHTRPNPPSIEELQADLARKHRVQMNAVILEARDKEERERLAQPSRSQVPRPHLGKGPEQMRDEPPVDIRSDATPTPVRDPWAEAKRGSDGPQSWTPVVRRK
ncbi:hypothetical protein J3R83DRAFT_5026 [Lanmaoa asiatica]|nr:hypothetical protein J3R83DRAFT_5026 [Lanmaoa asiatica]